MKKLVTLSAIALAGATLGVGTTFGWWADDPNEKTPKTTSQSADQIPNDVQGLDFEINVDQLPPQNAVRTLTSGALILDSTIENAQPGNVPQGQIRFVEAVAASPDVEKLAAELEAEAKQFEGHGQKEAAEIQRKLAARLRQFFKAGQRDFIYRKAAVGEGLQVVVPAPQAKGGEKDQKRKAVVREEEIILNGDKVQKKSLEFMTDPASRPKSQAAAQQDVIIHYKKPVTIVGKTVYQDVYESKSIAGPKHVVAQVYPGHDSKVEILKQEIAKHQDALKQLEDSNKRQQVEAEMQATKVQLQQILAQQAALRAKHAAESQKGRVEQYELAYTQPVKSEQLHGVARELREIAERLEKDGKKDEAQALRNQAERLLPKPNVPHLTITLGEDGPLNQHHPELKVFHHKLGEQAEKMAILRLKQSQDAKAARFEEYRRAHPEGHHEAHHEAHHGRGPDHGAPGGPHLGEIHKILGQLHHEIAALREEVRGLRGLLKSEPRAGKRDRDDDDDGDDEEEMEHRKPKGDDVRETKVRQRGDDDAQTSGKKSGADDAAHLESRRLQGDEVRKTKVKERDGDAAKSKIKDRDGDDGKPKERDDDDDEDDDQLEDRQETDEEAQSSRANGAFQFLLGLTR